MQSITGAAIDVGEILTPFKVALSIILDFLVPPLSQQSQADQQHHKQINGVLSRRDATKKALSLDAEFKMTKFLHRHLTGNGRNGAPNQLSLVELASDFANHAWVGSFVRDLIFYACDWRWWCCWCCCC